MSVELIDVPGRPASPFYKHVAIAAGSRTVYIAGQVGTDEQGQVVPGGLAAQAERALRNVGLALEAAGAAPGDLAKLTIYVAGWEPSMLDEMGAGLMAADADQGLPPVPMTLIGVASLFEPEMLIEIEAVAVCP